jgi:hypothetical protein
MKFSDLKNLSIYLVIFLSTFLMFSACSEENSLEVPFPTSLGVLSEQVVADLQFLREEEKLARDVYLFAYEQHGLNIFNNIAKSEQQHTDQVKLLLDQYGIEDPASTQEGVFINETLQQLYIDLTTKAALSLTDALEVGATIEDLDIRDLNTMAKNSERDDISLLYQNLACGSANHMRSFYSLLQHQGVNYEVQFISEAELQTILTASNSGCGGL